jgi:signal transduction histidine kinase/CheY-like chemotaxis protein
MTFQFQQLFGSLSQNMLRANKGPIRMSPKQDKLRHLEEMRFAQARSLITVVSALGGIGAGIWVPLVVYWGEPGIASLAVLASASGLASFMLARRGNVELAAHIYLIAIGLVIAVSGVLIHPHSFVTALYIPFITLSFMIYYEGRHFHYAVMYAVFFVALYVFCLWVNAAFIRSYLVDHDFVETYVREPMLLTVLLLTALQAFYFSWVLGRGQESLKSAVLDSEAANDAKSNFLAAMSHEIRTPMNGVVGMVELMLTKKRDDHDREMLETVKASSFSLLRIIDDILDTAKIEAGKMTLSEEYTDLGDVLFGVRNTLKPVAQSQHVELDVQISPEVHRYVYADDGRLRQIVLNIVGNAVKFSDRSDGQRPGPVEIRLTEQQSGTYVISVKDHGIGMTPDLVAGLFNPFTQSEDAINRRFGGTGLGLTIAKSLVDMMNGTIHVESERGVGSVFTITLTLAHAPERVTIKAQSAPQTIVQQASGLRVLVVEDNAVNRMVIERQLLSLGFSVSSAENGKRGFEKWQSGEFALVLSDCHMPVMNGFEMTGAIRTKEAENGLARTPIIAITANALDGEEDRCYAAGMDAYLSKPVRLDDLKSTLASILRLENL